MTEESFQAAKSQVGLDQHQVRCWDSWYRFTTLAIAALAVLVICTVQARATTDQPIHAELIPLTVHEIRRLFNAVIITRVQEMAHRLCWSHWRRRHQARARRAHYQRRLSLEYQP